MLTRIYKCQKKIKNESDEDILKYCLNKDINIIDIIGQGTFGVVYKAMYEHREIAIKKIPIEYKTEKREQILQDLVYEVEYSYVMANHEIGPDIYNAFYLDDKIDNTNIIICYILMESFQNSVENIYNMNLSVNDYINIHSQIIKILYRQVFDCHMYCTDIKPSNFVLSRVKNKFKVREIDFGTDWCTLDSLPIEYRNSVIFYVVICIQMCLLIIKKIAIAIESGHFDADKLVKIIKPFMTDDYFNQVVSRQNEEVVKKILRDILTGQNKIVHRHYLTWVLDLKDDVNVNQLVYGIFEAIYLYKELYLDYVNSIS